MNNGDDLSKIAGEQVTLIIPNTEKLGKLESLNPEFSLNTKYKNADDWASLKDKPIRCYYMGIKSVPNEKGELVVCGIFISPKEVFLSGQTVLVEAIKNLPVETPLQITYRGKRQNKSTLGSTMIFDVEKLGKE